MPMNKETIHPFQKESAFELALCDVLTQHGWEKDILVQASEEDLVENWAQIIFDNNRGFKERQQQTQQQGAPHKLCGLELSEKQREALDGGKTGGAYRATLLVRPYCPAEGSQQTPRLFSGQDPLDSPEPL